MTQAFRYVIVPMTRPIAATIVVLTLMRPGTTTCCRWSSSRTPPKQTVTLLPQFFVSQFSNDQTKVLASAVITAIPEILVYLLLQRFFERGLAAGAIEVAVVPVAPAAAGKESSDMSTNNMRSSAPRGAGSSNRQGEAVRLRGSRSAAG